MLNQQQGRVIDPILTTFARGYLQNDLISSLIFPEVDVPVSGGQVITFGKEAFMLYDTQRVPGGSTTRIEISYNGQPYALENHALEVPVPDELGRDAMIVPGIDLAQESLGVALDAIMLRREYQAVQLASNAANYAASNKLALSGVTQWSNAASTPKNDLVTAKAAIRAATGKFPNVAVLPPGGIAKLDNHALIRDRLKFTSSDSVNADMLARYFEVDKVVECNAVYATSANANMSDVWGNNVLFAYVAPARGTARSARTPSFGYTYRLRGHPFVKVPYRDENRESWVYGVHYERAPVIAGAGAGFLLQNVF